MRKCVSMNNLSEYEPVSNTSNPSDNSGNELPKAAADGGVAAGYASADDAVPQPSNGSRERKRGVPWTEEEHKLFLLGLQKVTAMPMEEGKKQKDSSTSPAPQPTTMPLPVNSNINGFSVMPFPVTGGPVLINARCESYGKPDSK
ncbi:UNVERIFIED_CONTAM: Transcription factor R1 [Sesamum radiatum]|uniref:Transcription factor R1 n=1 Tax=Sesamum radiatum TaxID=300843 RepID=A0AAW2RYT2_SESRA